MRCSARSRRSPPNFSRWMVTSRSGPVSQPHRRPIDGILTPSSCHRWGSILRRVPIVVPLLGIWRLLLPQRADGADRVRLVGALVGAVAQYPREPQGDAAGVALARLDSVERDLDH